MTGSSSSAPAAPRVHGRSDSPGPGPDDAAIRPCLFSHRSRAATAAAHEAELAPQRRETGLADRGHVLDAVLVHRRPAAQPAGLGFRRASLAHDGDLLSGVMPAQPDRGRRAAPAMPRAG